MINRAEGKSCQKCRIAASEGVGIFSRLAAGKRQIGLDNILTEVYNLSKARQKTTFAQINFEEELK